MANIRIGKGHTFNVGKIAMVITRCPGCAQEMILRPQHPGTEEEFTHEACGYTFKRKIDKCYNGFRW